MYFFFWVFPVAGNKGKKKMKKKRKKKGAEKLIWATAQLYCDRKFVLQAWVCSWMALYCKRQERRLVELYCNTVYCIAKGGLVWVGCIVIG